MTELGNEYRDTIAQILKLAKIVNIDVDNLDLQPIDIDPCNKVNVNPAVSKEYVRYTSLFLITITFCFKIRDKIIQRKICIRCTYSLTTINVV